MIKFERHQEVLNETDSYLTIAHFIRRKGSDEDWQYCGTVTSYADGSSELEDADL